MQRVLSGGLWDEVGGLARKVERKIAAVAYVSSDKKVKFGRGDLLIADASDEAVATGQTSASVLRAAHRRGAALYCTPGLHAKLLCLGHHVVVGSANLSENSAGSLVEVALVTDNPKTLAESRAFIESVRRTATVIDDAFLARIEAIPVSRRVGHSRSWQSSPQVVVPSGRTWLVGVSPVSKKIAEAEQELAEAGEEEAEAALTEEDSHVSFVRATGTSGFCREAQPGDTIIQIWRQTRKLKRADVYYAAPILRRQEEPTCTRFYVEAFTDEDARSISWSDFRRIWKNAADSKVPSMTCARALTDRLAERLLGLWPTPD